jgi:hypothetical protein
MSGMRKRRLPRLGTAIWTASPGGQFDWAALEKAIGNPFTPAQREEIAKLVRHYLLLEGAERAAPFKRDRDSWLYRLDDVARSLQDILTRRPMLDRASRDGYAEVKMRFDKIAREACGHTLPLDYVAAFLVSAVEAADLEMKDDLLGFEEGERWCELVSKLRSRFTEWGFPSGVRKDDGERHSPFVVFFHTLQQQCPADARRHTQSMPALAKAIWEQSGH